MSNKESNKKNQRKIKQITRAPVMSAALLRMQAPPRFSLYRFVYESMTSAVLCFFLIVSFFSQGVSLVFANEQTGGDELVAIPLVDSGAEEPPTPEPEVVENSEPDEVIVQEPEPVETTADGGEPDSLPIDDVSSSETSTADDDGATVEETSSVSGIDDTTPSADAEVILDEEDSVDDDTLPADTDEASSTVSSDTTEVSDEDSVPDDDTPPTEELSGDDGDLSETPTVEATTTATTSELIGPGITDPVGTNYSDSGFMFSKNECTELASGSFYCLEPRVNVLEDALFAAPDKDGDLEIFLVRNGAQTQVTDNFVDDAAPFFDQNSETIVWHRLIDDRYQIISYDLASGEETQLTKNGTNNMEPVRQGKYTVWQRWVGNNWDIILYDGQKEIQVSHASAHDIAPYIHGALVVWNRYGATGDKTIEMFDIASETYVTVDDPEGLSVTNPRMVLVYDQMHPNGDIVTKGYDMIARKFIQLDTLPRDLPDEIPESDPTNETRALIQSKPTVKGDEVVSEDVVGGGEPPLLPELEATSTESLTLDLSQETTELPVTVDSTMTELSDFDLIITPLASSSETAQASVQE